MNYLLSYLTGEALKTVQGLKLSERSYSAAHKKKLTNFMIWEMLGFSRQFSIAWENATKPIVWGEPAKLVIVLFP